MRRVLTVPMTLVLVMIASIGLAAGPGVSAAPQMNAQPAAQVAPAAFSSPTHVTTGSFAAVAAVVDGTNHVHIAATGNSGVWYATNRSGSWVSHKIIGNPAHGGWYGPLIAIDDNDRVYVAATKWQGPEIPSNMGVFYVTDKGRARGTFPSSPTQIAAAGKSGQSLKINGGHIYLSLDYDICCVSPDWPPVWFRTNASGSWVTTKLGNGWGPSMRLATNGRARIVYSAQVGLRYAVAATTTGSFSTTTIPGTTSNDMGPILSLDAQGYSAAAWLHSTASGWIERYSTRKSGSWSTPVAVVSSSLGFDAVSFDTDTLGRPHIVVANADDRILRDWRLAGGTWTATKIAGPAGVNSVSVRRAPSGTVVVAWVTGSGIYVSRG